MPPSTKVVAKTFGLVVQHVRHVVGEKAHRRSPPARSATRIIRAKCLASGSDGSPRNDADDLRPIQPHHRQDRPELDHHGEDAARRPGTEQPRTEEQVRGGGDRQELRQPLNHSQQRGDEQCHERRGLTRPGGVRACASSASAGAAAGADAVASLPGFSASLPDHGDRRRDEHARVRAGDDADDHREGEAVQHLTAEEEQRQRR